VGMSGNTWECQGGRAWTHMNVNPEMVKIMEMESKRMKNTKLATKEVRGGCKSDVSKTGEPGLQSFIIQSAAIQPCLIGSTRCR
jgi:hypothetical protein